MLLLRSAEASLGARRARTLAGSAEPGERRCALACLRKTTLVDFDPAPWWPGEADSLLTRGVNRLHVKGEFELDLPVASTGSRAAAARGDARQGDAGAGRQPARRRAAACGEASYANSNGDARSTVELLAAGNRLHAQGQLAAKPAQDAWQVSIDAAQLARLAPLLQPPRRGAASAPSGRQPDGERPDRRPLARPAQRDGELQAAALRLGPLAVRRGARPTGASAAPPTRR